MSQGVLESFTRQSIHAQRVSQVTFTWQGGELTLMGIDFFNQAVFLQQKYARPGMRIENALQTNATDLDDADNLILYSREATDQPQLVISYK